MMGKMRKALSGIALAMIVAFSVTFGSFNKSFAARWCFTGEGCELGIMIEYDEEYGGGEWFFLVNGNCSAGDGTGSGMFFGCGCDTYQIGFVPAPICSVM